MVYETTSKNIDGITDLVVIAPIKDGFIEAYENVTYATRLKLVSEALNRVRVSAREHERVVPFSDVTERILTLLDFRVGIIDKDLFSLSADKMGKSSGDSTAMKMESRRYLYLTATFDGAWEPYMRLIWDPLGPFLDLLFCNCEGYVTAADHSFAEYAQWVRDNQMDSAIFYATTGLTIRDHLYLSRLEQLQRSGHDDLTLAETVMAYPEDIAAITRDKHILKTIELGLEALTVLYKLADYYPPQWLTGNTGGLAKLNEGQRLVQVARDLLKGWDGLMGQLDSLPQAHPIYPRWSLAKQIYAEPLHWYKTGRSELARTEQMRIQARLPDPDFDRCELQGGIIEPQGESGAPIKTGALMLFTIRDTAEARAFLKNPIFHFAQGDGSAAKDGYFRTIGFTPAGLRRLGVDRETVERFPKEFREGMAARSGLIGDMRENHPRNWILPERNGPALAGVVPIAQKLPPVELSEVDFVIQIRSSNEGEAPLQDEVKRLADLAKAGASLEAVEWLERNYDPASGKVRDHFGFADGISQPQPKLPDSQPGDGALGRDTVPLGEIILGYGNSRSDAAPGAFGSQKDWRRKFRKEALELQKNGSFLVLRKIGQEAGAFDNWLGQTSMSINADYQLTKPMTPERLKALVLGRQADGTPLVPPNGGGDNDFDYASDPKGHACPFAAHVRRANPRKTDPNAQAPAASRMEFGRPTPRILRRGMSFSGTDDAGKMRKGLMFMAYNASIAEQYEVIQRWLNGGNSTDIGSAQNDPLTGVQPKADPEADTKMGTGVFRFIEQGVSGPVAVHVSLPPVKSKAGDDFGSEPGRHPFAPLYWGLYLFVPSRSALAKLADEDGHYSILEDPLEQAVGQVVINRLAAIGDNEAAQEWKRLLEDFDAKDPSQRDLSPNMWATIRWKMGGAHDLNNAVSLRGYDWQNGPKWEDQNVILVAGRSQVRQVLADWEHFTVEEQLRRIAPNSGPIFVTQQPDNKYRNTELNSKKLDYPAEAVGTNAILLAYDEEAGFDAGYAAGQEVLNNAKIPANASGKKSFKLELRRQYLLPALGGLCKKWYGLPDDKHMLEKGWTWEKIVAAGAQLTDADGQSLSRAQAHCPGDFLSPSRNAFYPRPSAAVAEFADNHGKAILQAAEAFVAEHQENGGPQEGSVARAMFAKIGDPKVLARNLIGTMVGAIPPMDGNLRGILLEWLGEKSLWRHQSALRSALAGKPANTDFAKAREALYQPVAQAMCKRPAPDLLYRTAKGEGLIERDGGHDPIVTQEGDMLVVSLVSAAQRSLLRLQGGDGQGDVSIVFGGKRKADAQGYNIEDGGAVPDPAGDDQYPVHACPAQNMAMGAIMGIMAALLDAGTIQALPASLIVRISDW